MGVDLVFLGVPFDFHHLLLERRRLLWCIIVKGLVFFLLTPAPCLFLLCCFSPPGLIDYLCVFMAAFRLENGGPALQVSPAERADACEAGKIFKKRSVGCTTKIDSALLFNLRALPFSPSLNCAAS